MKIENSQNIVCLRSQEEFRLFTGQDGHEHFTAVMPESTSDRRGFEENLRTFINIYRCTLSSLTRDLRIAFSDQRVDTFLGMARLFANGLAANEFSGLSFLLSSNFDSFFNPTVEQNRADHGLNQLSLVLESLFTEVLYFDLRKIIKPNFDRDCRGDNFEILVRGIPLENCSVNLSDISFDFPWMEIANAIEGPLSMERSVYNMY